MILNFEQWIRLQDNVYDAKEWFASVGLFKDYIETFKKIAYVTRHELSQVKGWDMWDEFLSDIPEDKRLPLKLVINFGNFRKQIDWPINENASLQYQKEFKEALKNGLDWHKTWTNKHSFFGRPSTTVTYIHYDPTLYGGMVWICEDHPDSKYFKESQWGIVVNDRNWIPISVEF